MTSFSSNQSIQQFQQFIQDVYGVPDDRYYSLYDLLSNQERFTMRALKGIRKGNKQHLKKNLLIAFSWSVAVFNRLHLDIENALWHRFPNFCSYCGHRPCTCHKEKPAQRILRRQSPQQQPQSLNDFQEMFRVIYPPSTRTLAEAGVHLAEEMGEVSEAIQAFLGEHKVSQFDNLKDEAADWVSCMFGVANSAEISIAKELALIYKKGCHVCHRAPCACTYSSVTRYSS